MPKEVSVVAAQLGPASDSRQQNVDMIVQLIDEAADRGGQVICFPELALTKYFGHWNTRNFRDMFDTVPGPMADQIRERAAARGIAVILPLGERDDITFYNTAFVIGTNGDIIGKYRKMHIPGSFPDPNAGTFTYERLYFTPGNLGFPVFDLGFARVGVQICHDRNFPEGYRCLALHGAEIIFTPNNMPRVGGVWGADIWETTLRLRAYENGSFVVGVGKAGVEDDLPYVGHSVIISPLGGAVLATAETDGNELVMARIDLDDTIEARTRMPFPRDRRPEYYGLLSDVRGTVTR